MRVFLFPFRFRAHWIVLLSLFLFGVPLSAQPSTETRFSLQDAIRMALQNNPEIAAASENIQVFKGAVDVTSAAFDPTVYLDVRADQSIRETASLIETGVIDTDNRLTQNAQTFKTGIKRRLLWGGEYDLSFTQGRATASLQEMNPTFNGDLSVTLTQPLLRGFGRAIAASPRLIAQMQREMADADFQIRWLEVISSVCNTYWNWVFAHKNLEIQQQRLLSARQLIEINQAKVDLGLLAPIEVLVAEAGMASREEEVVIAEAEVSAEEERMRLLLNVPVLPPRPTDLPTEISISPEETQIDESLLLSMALKRRPELRKQRLEVERGLLALQQAHNQALPALDLVASAGPNGLGSGYGKALSQVASGNFYRWDAGLFFSYPLGNRAATAQLEQETSQWKVARHHYEKVERQVTLEAREGFRRIRTDLKRIETTRRALQLSEKKRTAADERFSFGLINSHDLLAFQDDLADAQGRALKAVIDYNKSLIGLEKATGVLPDRVDRVEAH